MITTQQSDDVLLAIVKSQMTTYFGSPPPDDDYHDFISTIGTVRNLCLACVKAGMHHIESLSQP